MPNIPNVDADITLSKEDSVHLLLASIAFEELGQAHLINAEAEKIQYILGTLEGVATPPAPSIEELLEANRSVDRMLKISSKIKCSCNLSWRTPSKSPSNKKLSRKVISYPA